ncbi:c-type cytochrome [Marinobacter subterrani]|uniref:c-type cytochrome n=1 Tax=Marinobacter subterrani TaxID=1658765 RepID=UPI002355B82A|nr:cytochrome c [Marinobacter subterrani]
MGRSICWRQTPGLALLCLALATAHAADTGRRSDAELGNLVLQDCGSCHGMTLKGGLGPPLRPDNLERLPVEAISAIIREGVPDTAMPPWKPLLTPEETDWISRQLKSGALLH